MKEITVGFSMHRPETLKSTIRRMHQHDTIFLEDPPTPGFHQMLNGQQSIEKYLLETETEYPRFTEIYCKYLRRLYDAGKSIFQVEPYLDLLIGIHEHFAAGGSPDDIDPKSSSYSVYQAEKLATGLLLGYYRIAMVGSFEKTVKSVKKFAQADAARFVLRDSLRADALLSSMRPFSKVYIEAGDMHQYLFTRLKNHKNENVHIVRCYPMESIMHSLTGKRYLYAPGDRLTLSYIFNLAHEEKMLDLFAARSLIYNKLLTKNEISDDINTYPHTRDQIDVIKKTQRLSWQDCRDLFKKIRLVKTHKARKTVDEHLKNQ